MAFATESFARRAGWLGVTSTADEVDDFLDRLEQNVERLDVETQGVKRKEARRAEAATKRRDANLRRDLGDRDIPEGYEALFR